MNFRIAICDDDKKYVSYIDELIKKWADNNSCVVSIFKFYSAEAFEFAFSEDKSFDIIILDIQMSGMSGVELAHKIRQKDKNIQIIFVTGYSDYIEKGYDVMAIHYLIKPVNEEKLFCALDMAVKSRHIQRKSHLFKIDNDIVKIYEDEIMYAEAELHFIYINTISEKFKINIGISEIDDILCKDDFFRCHRSYVVSLSFIKKIEKTEIILDNNIKIPLSRRRYKDIADAFIRYFNGEKYEIL